jgi:hypothetical protein
VTHAVNAGQALTETRKLLAEARDWLQRREGELAELQSALQEAVRVLQTPLHIISTQGPASAGTSTAGRTRCMEGCLSSCGPSSQLSARTQ